MSDRPNKLISFRQAIGEGGPQTAQPPAVPVQSIPQMLAEISDERFDRGLLAGKEVARQRHKFYPNEITPAVEFIQHLRRSAHKILVAYPMQSGKTNIMACIMVILRHLIGANGGQRIRGVYICANNQLDFRNMAIKFLAHHMEVLALKDRRKWQDTSSAPVVLFFDESHFGDGDSMTIYKFLQKHNVLFDDLHKMVFCGVSATPFTSCGPDVMDAQVVADLAMLEACSYNSVGMMLERGRIVEAEPMIVNEEGQRPSALDARDPTKIFLNLDANVFRHIDRIVSGPRLQGYCLVRSASVLHAEMVKNWLEGHYGQKVYVVMWNQHHRTFTPDSFFSDPRPDKLTVVLVQHKARMGNQIDTRHCHFLYEMPAVSSKIDTISQSFIGRACGFGKQDHTATIYSSVDVAEIYDHSMMGGRPDMAKFFDLCERSGRRPSLRAEMVAQVDAYVLDHVDTVRFARDKNPNRQIERQIMALKTKHAHLIRVRGTVRRYSRWSIPKSRSIGSSMSGMIACKSEPGSWAIAIFDRKYEGKGAERRLIRTKFIEIALYVRSHVKPTTRPKMLRPKRSSFFSHIVADRQRETAGVPRSPSLTQGVLPGTLAPRLMAANANLLDIAKTFQLPDHLRA